MGCMLPTILFFIYLIGNLPFELNDFTTSSVSSVDPSSTISHSKSQNGWLIRLSNNRGNVFALLYAGVKTVNNIVSIVLYRCYARGFISSLVVSVTSGVLLEIGEGFGHEEISGEGGEEVVAAAVLFDEALLERLLVAAVKGEEVGIQQYIDAAQDVVIR